MTWRGDRCEPITQDDINRAAFLDILAQARKRFGAQA